MISATQLGIHRFKGVDTGLEVCSYLSNMACTAAMALALPSLLLEAISDELLEGIYERGY